MGSYVQADLGEWGVRLAGVALAGQLSKQTWGSASYSAYARLVLSWAAMSKQTWERMWEWEVIITGPGESSTGATHVGNGGTSIGGPIVDSSGFHMTIEGT